MKSFYNCHQIPVFCSTIFSFDSRVKQYDCKLPLHDPSNWPSPPWTLHTGRFCKSIISYRTLPFLPYLVVNMSLMQGNWRTSLSNTFSLLIFDLSSLLTYLFEYILHSFPPVSRLQSMPSEAKGLRNNKLFPQIVPESSPNLLQNTISYYLLLHLIQLPIVIVVPNVHSGRNGCSHDWIDSWTWMIDLSPTFPITDTGHGTRPPHARSTSRVIAGLQKGKITAYLNA